MNKRTLLAVALLAATVFLLPAADKEPVHLLKPINLSVNTKADEDEPHVSKDGRLLLYTSTKDGKTSLYASSRDLPSQPWRPGKEADDLSVISDKTELRGIFLPGGRPPFYVYYAAKKIGEKEASFDIFVAIKPLPGPDKVFNSPRAIEKIDTAGGDEMYPWLTPDGNNLYFSRKTKEGWRVLMSKRDAEKGPLAFDEPTTLDLPPNYFHATLTPDGKTMYLQGSLEKARTGLFVSTKTAKGWSGPDPLESLNHPDAPTGDQSPCLSRDGKMLYFASDRPGGKGGLDLWVIATEKLLRMK